MPAGAVNARRAIAAGCAVFLVVACKPAAESTAMDLASTAFAPGGAIPAEFTCDGADRSPPLQWSDPPENTRSFILAVEDPDAPNGAFRHWAAYNLSGDLRALDAGAGSSEAEDFRQARNDFGKTGYGGPCPPPGDGPHRYRFHLLALDVPALHFEGTPTVKQVLDSAEPHRLASSVLTGRYGR